MNKRAIIILGAIFLLIVATLGFLIYQNSKTKTPTPVAVETPVVEDTPPVEEPQKVNGAVRLTDESVVSPILFYQGNGISYFNTQGQLFQTDLQVTDNAALLSNKKELSIALKANIEKILWPSTGNNFIAEFKNGSKPTWSVYETSKAAYSDIPTQVYSLDWMPGGDKVMFVWVDGNGKATLNIGNPDTTGYQTLTEFYEPDNVIGVSPDGKNVLFHRTQTADSSKNIINMVSTDGKTFTSIVKDGYNVGVKWSPDSSKFLFTKRDSSSQKFNLWMANISTGEVRNLGVSTSVDKAVWSKNGESVFVGVPTTGVAGQGLTQDAIYKITISTAQQQQYDPGVAVDTQDLFLSSDEQILFFRNGQDNALYYISVQ